MQICNDLNMHKSNLYKSITEYDDGETGFLPRNKNKMYSADFKEKAVNEYLAGEGSYRDIARKYKVPSSSSLKKWVFKYNGYEKLKDYFPKGEKQR